MLNQKTKSKLIIGAIAMLIIAATVMIVMNAVQNNSTTVSVVSKRYLESNEEKTGKIIVKYLDKYGNEIASETELTGKVGEEYSVEAAKVKNYTVDKYPFNRKGNFDLSTQTVDFIYRKDLSSVEGKSDGENVVVTVLKNKSDGIEDYKLIIKTVDEEGKPVTETMYKTVNTNNAVERHSTDYTGNYVVGSITLDDVPTEKYTISETKTAEGFIALDGTINLTINKTKNNDQYVLDAYLEEKENVSLDVNKVDKEIVITVVKKLVPPPQPPETGEKIFDLAIEKNIKTVRVKNSTEDKIITKKNKDELVKVDLPKSKLTDTELTITYEITVKNVGEVNGYATLITDKLAERMNVLENENWTVENKYAFLTKFDSTELKPGDSISEKLITSINLTNDDVGQIINKASISAYYNDQGLKDNTPDNDTQEALLVTLKTGHQELIPLASVILVIAITGIVYIIKKRRTEDK